MKTKTAELQGAALDWAVWKIEHSGAKTDDELVAALSVWSPSTDWAQAGPIIERERIACWSTCRDMQAIWFAEYPDTACLSRGPTPLIAAMRCFVDCKLGDEIEIPDELA